MLDSVKLNKMAAMMVGATQAEADNAYRAIVKMVRANNVAPSNVHLHVYGDEDDYVGSVLKASSSSRGVDCRRRQHAGSVCRHHGMRW